MFKVRRWLRWLVLLPLGLAGWALVALFWFGPRWVEQELPVRLAAALEAKTVTIGGVESDLLRLSFHVRDLSIKTAEGREIMACPDVWVRASWSTLLGGEREVSSVRLEEPVFHVRKGAEGWLSDWRLAESSGEVKPLKISMININRGALELVGETVSPVRLGELELTLENFDSSSGAEVKLSGSLVSKAVLAAQGRLDFAGDELFRGEVRAEGLKPADASPWTGRGFWKEGSLAFSGAVLSAKNKDGLVWSLRDGQATVEKPLVRHLETLEIRAEIAVATGLQSTDLSQHFTAGAVTVTGGGIFGVIPGLPATPAASPAGIYPWSVGTVDWKDFSVALETSSGDPRKLELEKLHATLEKFASGWEGQALFLGPLALPGEPWKLSGFFAGGMLQAEGRGKTAVMSLRGASLSQLKPWILLPPSWENVGGTGSLTLNLANEGDRWKGAVLGELSDVSYDAPGLGRQQAAYVRVESKLSGARGDFTPGESVADLRVRGVRISMKRMGKEPFLTPWSAFAVGTVESRWKLGKLILEDAEVDHDDQAMEPPFRAVWQMHGEIGASGPEGHRDFEMRGGIAGNAGVVRLKGNADFSSPASHLFLEAAVTGFDLRPFSAWSVLHAGRPLLGGTLDGVSVLVTAKGKLKATNELRFQSLSFGPNARKELPTDVPVVRMANLLRDRNGVVKLSLPVEGDLIQPDFRYAPALWSALRRTSARVLSAPLRALGEIFGDNRVALGEVERMTFLQGSVEVPAQAQILLGHLASFLKNRPGITLEISGGSAYSESHLLRVEALQLMIEDNMGYPPRTFEEYERALRSEFEKAFPGELRITAEPTVTPVPPPPVPLGFWARLFGRKAETPPPPTPTPPPALPLQKKVWADPSDPLPPEMEERLLETIVVPISALDDLATVRARAVRAFLVGAGVEEVRLKVVGYSVENAAVVRIHLP